MKILPLKNLYFFIFLSVVLFYCLFLSQYGFENWDTGFMTGFSWRISNGENAYQDFTYIRPPISAYFHAIFLEILPQNGQYYFIRIIGYFLFATQVFFAVSGFDNLFNLKNWKANKWALMTICFVISIHNFFSNAWFTTDGILFATIAFYLMTLKEASFFKFFFVAFFAILSALTKQSFYPIPIIFLIWIFVSTQIKPIIYYIISSIIISCVILFWINSFSTFETFIQQTKQNAGFKDIIHTGLEVYIRCFNNKYLFAGLLISPLFSTFIENRNKKGSLLFLYLKWLSVALFLTSLIYLFFIEIKQSSIIFFNASLIAFAYKVGSDFQKIKNYFPILVLLGISWCSGLSLGYSYPILFITGPILGFFYLMQEDFAQYNLQKVYIWMAIPVCIFVFSTNQRPYREKNIFDLKYSLETVSAKLKYIYTSKENLEKYLDLKNLIKKFGSNYVTVPSIPQSHYIFNQKNPISADWLTNFEINNKTEDFLKLIATKSNYIFLEKSFIENEEFIENDENRKEFSLLSWQIYKNLKPVFETDNFFVYRSSDLLK